MITVVCADFHSQPTENEKHLKERDFSHQEKGVPPIVTDLPHELDLNFCNVFSSNQNLLGLPYCASEPHVGMLFLSLSLVLILLR